MYEVKRSGLRSILSAKSYWKLRAPTSPQKVKRGIDPVPNEATMRPTSRCGVQYEVVG